LSLPPPSPAVPSPNLRLGDSSLALRRGWGCGGTFPQPPVGGLIPGSTAVGDAAVPSPNLQLGDLSLAPCVPPLRGAVGWISPLLAGALGARRSAAPRPRVLPSRRGGAPRCPPLQT